MMTIPQETLTVSDFADHLRRAVNSGPGKTVTARSLAHMCKVSVGEVDSWFRGEKLPEIRAFARVVFVFPNLRHLKPQLIEAHRVAWLRDHPAQPPQPEVTTTRRPEHFGLELAALRSADGLSQQDIADLLKVTNQAVSAWEASVSTPVREHYDALVQIWSELARFTPPVRDINPPDGGEGVPRGPSSGTRPTRLTVVDPPTPQFTAPKEPPPMATHPPVFVPAAVAPLAKASGPTGDRLLAWLDVLPTLGSDTLTSKEVLALLDLADADGVPPSKLASMIRRARG